MLDALTEGLVLLSPTGEIVDWNAAAITTLGLSADELGGRTPMDTRWEAIHTDGSPWPGESHPSTLAATTGRVIPEQLMGVKRPTGELVWLQVNARPIHDDSGAVAGAIAAFLDVTASVDLRRHTDELTLRLRSAIDNGAVGIALLDERGRISYANPALIAIAGSEAHDLLGLRLTDLIHPNDPALAELRSLDIGRQLTSTRDVQLLVDGKRTRWIELNVTELPALRGVTSSLVQVTDITERRELVDRIRRSEELARVSLDALDQGVIFASPTLGISRMNPAASTILGYTAEELYALWSSPTWSMFDERGDRLPAQDFSGLRAIETGETVRHQILWLLHKEDGWRRVRMSAVPFGWTDEVILFFTDITDLTPDDAPRPHQ